MSKMLRRCSDWAVRKGTHLWTGQVEQYRSGNQKVIGWFVGQVMKETQGKANPQAVNEILRARLGG